MSQLIQMRQRIKTIETIKKITHAMRLIAMSSHGRLKNKQETLSSYCKEIQTLFLHLQSTQSNWTNSIVHPNGAINRPLAIIVSSGKGLCGNFNSALFTLCKNHLDFNNPPTIITVGAKAYDFVANKMGIIPATYFMELSTQNYLSLAHKIGDLIIQAQPLYSEITLFSNYAKSFFTQKPTITQLIPLDTSIIHQEPKSEFQYLIDQPIHEILDSLAEQYIMAHIQHIFFESLLAEQSARFISMDNSTRNANNLLETTKLQYNKLRQAKITNELIELTGTLSS